MIDDISQGAQNLAVAGSGELHLVVGYSGQGREVTDDEVVFA